jgi:hypothetical protein
MFLPAAVPLDFREVAARFFQRICAPIGTVRAPALRCGETGRRRPRGYTGRRPSRPIEIAAQTLILWVSAPPAPEAAPVHRLGDRLVVGLRTLTPPAGVRIPLPQPFKINHLSLECCACDKGSGSPGDRSSPTSLHWSQFPARMRHPAPTCRYRPPWHSGGISRPGKLVWWSRSRHAACFRSGWCPEGVSAALQLTRHHPCV